MPRSRLPGLKHAVYETPGISFVLEACMSRFLKSVEIVRASGVPDIMTGCFI